MTKVKGGLSLRSRLSIVAGILLGTTALSSTATQYIAGRFNRDPVLGQPIVGQLYEPFGWVDWQFKPWAKPYQATFKPVNLAMLGLAIAGLGAGALASNGGRKPKHYDDVHGSAGFMEPEDVEKSGYINLEQGVYIGAWTAPNGDVHYLRHDGSEHISAIAPTRSGKGVGLVIPTLLSWLQSTVIFDEKGELWALTAGWRQQAGNAVLRWQPGHPTNSCGFNFLAEIRLGTEYDVADAQNIAVMVIDPDGRGLKDHWDRTAFGLLSGVILHVLYKAREQGRVASLPDVAFALSDPSRPIAALYAEMATNRHDNGNLHKAVAAAGADQLNREDKERSAVLSTVTTYMQIFQDPIVARNSAHSDFRIADIMNYHKPVSLYIVVPGSDKIKLRPLVRLMLTMLIKGLTAATIEFDLQSNPIKRFLRRTTFDTTRKPKLPHKHRLLFMLDEFPSLGKLAVVEDALAKCAGFGIKAYLIMQDREQLLAAYPHETILSNCHIRVVYAPNKFETAEWISKELDTQTINLHVYTESGKRSGYLSQVSHSITQTGRALMTPGEVMRMPAPTKDGDKITAPGEMLIMTAGKRPIRGRQPLYFEDPTFKERANILPPPKTDALSGSRFHIP